MTAMTMPGTGRRDLIRRRPVRAIKIHWPVSHRTVAAVGAGDVEVLRDDESLAALLRELRASPGVGDFGLYEDVFEVSIGAEGFTPKDGALPAFGAVGGRTLSPTLALTTYIDAAAGEDEISQVLARIVAAHPWEVPVVEFSAPLELVSRA